MGIVALSSVLSRDAAASLLQTTDSADELPSPNWGSKPDQGVRPGPGCGAYTFNHEESVRCFEKALRLSLDPDLAIAVGHRVLGGPGVQRGPGRTRPGRAWSVAGPGSHGAAAGRATAPHPGFRLR
jgi:hypothetical protein